MIAQLILFAVGLAFGAIGRVAFVLLSKLEKAIALRPITIIMDIVLSGAMVSAFVLLQNFLSDGVFVPFMLLSSIMGFALCSLLI